MFIDQGIDSDLDRESVGEISYGPPKEAIWSAATCRRFELSISESIEEDISVPMQYQVTKSGDKSPHSKLLP